MNVVDLEDPRIWLTPDDARTVQSAGADFARALAGAPSEAFMLALGEQEELLRAAVRGAGYSSRRARLAAIEFTSAARTEWGRVLPAISTRVGHA